MSCLAFIYSVKFLNRDKSTPNVEKLFSRRQINKGGTLPVMILSYVNGFCLSINSRLRTYPFTELTERVVPVWKIRFTHGLWFLVIIILFLIMFVITLSAL